jgi:hypothetical protein
MANGGTKTYTKDEEISDLKKDFEIAELKLKILQMKANSTALKQALNESPKTKEPIAVEPY